MDRDPRFHLRRIEPAIAGIVGFIGGCFVFFIVAYRGLCLMPLPEYTGDPTDVDMKGHVEDLQYLKLTALSGFAAMIGGLLGAANAVAFEQNGFRFSLGSLLITTTLIAVALGIIFASL
jgi:hypothetical protein